MHIASISQPIVKARMNWKPSTTKNGIRYVGRLFVNGNFV